MFEVCVLFLSLYHHHVFLLFLCVLPPRCSPSLLQASTSREQVTVIVIVRHGMMKYRIRRATATKITQNNISYE